MRQQLTLLRFALLLCVFASVFSTRAETAADPASAFIVDSWDVEKGLPDSEAVAVLQTKDGYLWIGTLHGLARFDGNKFTIFNQANTPDLNSDRIVFLFEDSASNLWVGTDAGGLLAIRNGFIKTFDVPARAGKIVYAQQQAGDDILFAAENGFINYHDGKITFYPPNFAAPYLSKLLVPSKTGGLWHLAGGSVQLWKDNHPEHDFGDSPWGSADVGATLEDQHTNLIVGTRGAGVFMLNAGGHWQNISTNQGLSSVYVLSLCEDDEGNLWVGTDGGGLNRIKRKLFNTPSALSPKDAQSLSPDADGGFWTAFNAAGISHLDENGSAQNFGIGQASNAWTVLVTRQQQIFAGTRGLHDEGLFEFEQNRFVPVNDARTRDQQIFVLSEDRDGKIWVGAQRGLGNFDGQKWRWFTTRDGLSENSVRAIAQDANGNLWVGTENHGLNVFKNGKFSIVTNSPADISCLYADKDGVLWVGTSGHGLARLKNGNWKTISSADGLASDSIGYIFEDDGNFWIGSNLGLMRVSKKLLDDFADGRTNFFFCRTYGNADGLPTRECSSGSQPGACRTIDGRLWFPTTKGVASLVPSELKPNSVPPAVMIESVLVDGRQQKTNQLAAAWPQTVTVAPGGDQSKVQLEIHYTALDFSAPDLVKFKYRLDGYQNDWTEAGSERVARYPKLPPGKYHFDVVAYNEDGVPNQKSDLLEVIVQPQFWQTWWFRIGAGIVILAMVVGTVRYISTQKLQRQIQRHKQQEALERERARIARDLHDQLGANLTQVALLGEMAEADKHEPQEIESHAQQISQTARETTRSLDEIVWAINPANDTLEGLTNYAIKYAQEFFALADVRCRVDAPPQLPPISIPPEVRHNVFLAFKEAVNNVVKHAEAKEARIRLKLQPDIFILEIEDNGKGIYDLPAKQNRNGLKNMRKRMEDIRGNFEIARAQEQGTIARLIVPLATK